MNGMIPRMLSLLLGFALVLPAFGEVAEKTAKKTKQDGKAAVPKVGDLAPDFQLKGSDGKTYKLSDYRGKAGVVIAWYPKALTRG